MDKYSYKVLCFVNKHGGKVLYKDLINKFSYFSNPTIELVISWLEREDFAYPADYSTADSYGQVSCPETYLITMSGRQQLEFIKSKKSGDIFARIISVIAILISIASLAISYFKE